MKKLIVIVCLFVLVGCSEDKPKMFVELTQLTEEENKIAELLDANREQYIFNFKLDDHLQSLQINTYKLSDGSWERITGGGGYSINDSEGKIALDFTNLAYGVRRIAFQSEGSSYSIAFEEEKEKDLSRMGVVTSLANLTEITYEKEIPLVVQVISSKIKINSYPVDYFYTPEEYEKHNYEHVYAITVSFSEKSVMKNEIK